MLRWLHVPAGKIAPRSFKAIPITFDLKLVANMSSSPIVLANKFLGDMAPSFAIATNRFYGII